MERKGFRDKRSEGVCLKPQASTRDAHSTFSAGDWMKQGSQKHFKAFHTLVMEVEMKHGLVRHVYFSVLDF